MEDINMTKDMKSELTHRYNISTEDYKKDKICRKWLRAGIIAAIIMLMLISLLLLSSCEKKELCYLPHPHICHTTLTVNFNSEWDNEPIHSVYSRAGASEITPEMHMRYVLEFWNTDEEGNLTEIVERSSIMGGTLKPGKNTQVIEVDLPADKIAVLCWAEPLQAGQNANPYFDATSLKGIKMLQPLGLAPGKDAFSASVVWDYTEYQEPHPHGNAINLSQELTLLRPFGSYTVISNDMKEYFEKHGSNAPQPASATVNYQLWIPLMYDAFHQTAIGSVSEATYSYPVSVRTEGTEYTMAEDLIFIGPNNGTDNFYNFTVSSFAADDTPIHKSGNVEVRMQRNKHTLVYGAFLTERKTNSPGIDDSFDEEIEVVIPD